MADLASIVKAYDVRGTVPDQLNPEVARAIGAAFVQVLSADGPVERIVVGYDMRPSSPELAAAFAAGATALGADVVDAGLCSTDQLYFASGSLDIPGVMLTASHNPARYNGLKMCRKGAKPIGQDTGLTAIRDAAQAILDGADVVPVERPGVVAKQDLLVQYAGYLNALVDLSGSRPLKVVVDAGNGMAGHTIPAVFGKDLPLDVVPMYFELDGTFPNHEANPLEPANLVDLQKRVVAEGADIGLAFDGDADRCFFVDSDGAPVSPSAVTALVAVRELAKAPGGTIIHNLITSRAVPEIVAEHGGVAVRTRVGHSFIKEEMAKTGAVFGGEHSAHYYFKDFWGADTGLLAALHVLAALGETDAPLSELGARYERYAASGEINSTVADQAAKVAEIAATYADAETDTLDGLTVSLPDGAWFNVRASNTEPLLRLNVEAPTAERMAQVRDEALAIIRR
ncbi:phosphomannomutase/phosphoglucomutase [Longispora sp. NPDC051575]|uniref:phosphomannomutase/phosphoglucomutase n=1 Tax=Longispora sp. NPDC051575 TaxID=3154943 RepID=UPI0034369312